MSSCIQFEAELVFGVNLVGRRLKGLLCLVRMEELVSICLEVDLWGLVLRHSLAKGETVELNPDLTSALSCCGRVTRHVLVLV